MKVRTTLTVKLEPNDIKDLIIKYLKEQGTIQEGERFDIEFDSHIQHKGESRLGGGYSESLFDGCTIIITK